MSHQVAISKVPKVFQGMKYALIIFFLALYAEDFGAIW